MKPLQLAVRSLIRFKLYSGINILGLAFSLACVIILFRYIYQETTVNHFVKDVGRVYFATMQLRPENRHSYFNENRFYLSGVDNRYNESSFVDPLNSPLIEKSTFFTPYPDDKITSDEQIYNASVYATDSNFLKIFDYPLLKGSREKVLSEPHHAVISETFARKIFKDQDPVGRTLRHSSGKYVTITGVTGEPRTKSSFKFDLLVTYGLQNEWSFVNYTAIRLLPGADVKTLNKQNESFMHMQSFGGHIRFRFFPLKDYYFDKTLLHLNKTLEPRGNRNSIVVLSIVALLVLLVGLFNFINIYTVVMLKRAREFGMKKVFGSHPMQIIRQLLAENLVMTGIALGISWLLIEASRGFVEKVLEIPGLPHPEFDGLLSLSLLIGLPAVTSVYPFLRYYYAAPVSSLKSVNAGGNSVVSRTVFLFLQYMITFCLVVVSVFFIKQLDFMLKADLGYRTKDIIKVQFKRYTPTYDSNEVMTLGEWNRREAERKNRIEAFKQRLKESTLFTGWNTNNSPNGYYSDPSEMGLKFKTEGGEYNSVNCILVSSGYFDMYEIELKEGTSWKDMPEQTDRWKIIINETAWKLFGFTSIENARLYTEPDTRNTSPPDENSNPAYQVIGVVKDFKNGHLSKATQPILFSCSDYWGDDRLTVAVADGKKQQAIAFLKKHHDEIAGGDFHYTLVEDEIEAMYRDDKRVANIYSTFALIAILISALGLFGLSLFDVQQRYREIALRKVNGAQVKDIMILFLKKYIRLLGLSFAFAAPVSYIAIQKYVEGYANKAPVSWWIFALAVGITTCVSLGTLVFHIRKAANSNPAAVLKNE